MRELEIIRRIREACPPAGRVRVGIGDDAAVVSAPGGIVVVTTDLVVEGTHFARGADAALVGQKALAVSLSDVAAMGCRPTAAFVAVSLRRDLPSGYAADLMRGLSDLAREHDCPLAGGDTTETAGPVVLCTTVIGEPWADRDPVLRSGARAGEALFVTGELGGSLAGRHLRFRPRLAEARALVERYRPGGMLDLSDGLSTDAWHLARESGVSLRIEATRLPLAAEAGGDRSRALHDGEDFELLFTASPDAAAALQSAGLAGTRVTRIGTVGEGPASVRLVREDGTEEDLDAGGYEHFGHDAEP